MLKKTDRQLDNEMKDKIKMTELNEKITRPFASFKISVNPLAAHCQAAQSNTQTKAAK